MKQNFIRCTDSETIQKLKSLGYQLLEEKNGCATFINKVGSPTSFDQSKVAYTNILTMATS